MQHLIVFSGLPGTGKSSLAEAVGREMSIPVFAKDWLEATLRRCELGPGRADAPSLGYAAYELLTMLAQRQLMLGQSVILDCVAGQENLRRQWRDLASNYQAGWSVFECICHDEVVHRTRLATRQRGIPGWDELKWEEVERVRSYYEPWQEEHLTLDMVDPLPDNIQASLAFLCQRKLK
jgi:predicted kinase